jgi:hypothetical protein
MFEIWNAVILCGRDSERKQGFYVKKKGYSDN